MRFGIIGCPIGHSLSPTLHEYLLQKIGVKGCYQAFEIQPESLREAVSALKTLGFDGFNVTIPHKQTVMAHLDEVSEEAVRVGAVNTVCRRQNRWVGYNTDGAGFLRALQNNGVEVRNQSAVVLGAGGAARAVIFALIDESIGRLRVINRTLERAEKLVNEVCAKTSFTNIGFAGSSGKAAAGVIQSASLLVNATSVGTWPEADSTPLAFDSDLKNVTVVDLVYNPVETRFLRAARELGAATVDGLEMLIFQGIEAMRIWTEMHFDHTDFFKELKALLTQELRSYGQH
ncbi:MAG: shikimate dehydrogenase [bacterium]